MDRSSPKKRPPQYGVPDEDSPEWTEEDFRSARPVREVMPGLIEAAKKLRAARGRPKLEQPKVQVTLRLDAEVIKKFRAGGPGWQSRINDLLTNATKRRKRA